MEFSKDRSRKELAKFENKIVCFEGAQGGEVNIHGRLYSYLTISLYSIGQNNLVSRKEVKIDHLFLSDELTDNSRYAYGEAVVEKYQRVDGTRSYTLVTVPESRYEEKEGQLKLKSLWFKEADLRKEIKKRELKAKEERIEHLIRIQGKAEQTLPAQLEKYLQSLESELICYKFYRHEPPYRLTYRPEENDLISTRGAELYLIERCDFNLHKIIKEIDITNYDIDYFGRFSYVLKEYKRVTEEYYIQYEKDQKWREEERERERVKKEERESFRRYIEHCDSVLITRIKLVALGLAGVLTMIRPGLTIGVTMAATTVYFGLLHFKVIKPINFKEVSKILDEKLIEIYENIIY